MAEENFQRRLLEELLLFLEPMVRAGQDPANAYALIRATGWTPEVLLGSSAQTFLDAVSGIANTVSLVEGIIAEPPTQSLDTLADLESALTRVKDATDGIAKLPNAMGTVQPPELQNLAGELLEVLALTYLDRRSPALLEVLRALTIVRDEQRPEIVKGSVVAREQQRLPTLDLRRVPKLVADPIGELKKHYLPNGTHDVADVQQAAAILLPRLAELLVFTGAEALVGRGDRPPELAPAQEAVLERMITARWRPPLGESETELGLTLRPIAKNGEPGPGLLVVPFGQSTIDLLIGDWLLKVELTGDLQALLITATGADLYSDTSTVVERMALMAVLEKTATDGVAFRVGSNTGTRLEIGRFEISGQGAFAKDDIQYGVGVDFSSAAFVFSPGDGDGFLQKVLPKEGFRTDFDLAIGWNNSKGLYLRGSAGLEATLPVHKSLLGILTVDSVYLAVRTEGQDIQAIGAATASVKLGPFTGNVERMGLRAKFTFPAGGGNLGPAHVELSFKPPDGAGMVLDASAVVGGGYLLFDPANDQYAGVLQLELKGGISIKAIGLLTTRLPDGSRGFSLLLIISGEFPPIQLGYGFTLNGVGGLIGVNRTMVLEALRAGVKQGALDSILFPKDPVKNAPQIISDLRNFFPPTPGQFVIGPMAKLGWGAPKPLLAVDLGIVLEFPSPVRLAIMGRLRMVLPEEKAALVFLQMDVLGAIDFDKGDASIDATLVESRVATFPVTGDMAMRTNWGASPAFALAAGGFNPRFQPPPNFPALGRLAISLAAGDNPRLRLEAYLALTSNTAQIGARLDLYAAKDLGGPAGTVSVEAYLGFDTLFQFSPFAFVVDVGAAATLKRNGESLFAVQIGMTLTGPQPMHAWGKAAFEFLGKREIPFDVTIGEQEPQPTLPPGDPLGDLLAALTEKRNWSAQLPADGHALVTLRGGLPSADVLVHPLGALTVRQTAVPLGVEISKFGNAAPADGGPFDITRVWFNDESGSRDTKAVSDHFAPGQFFEMSDDEKLSRPAFESLRSGVSFGTGGFSHGTAVEAALGYDTAVIDKEEQVKREMKGYQVVQDVAALAGLGAAARSPMVETGSAKYAGPPQKISLEEPEYVVASTEDLHKPEDGQFTPPTGTSYIEAEEARRNAGANGGPARLQVVGGHEVAR